MDFEVLSKQYHGAKAADYDQRALSPVWRRETEAVEDALRMLPRGASIVDVPVGTGRFFDLYARYGLHPTGIDISNDMLAVAASKVAALGITASLRAGDIRELPLPNDSVDAAVCMRLAHWIDSDGLALVVRELARVARTCVIIGVPHYVPVAQLDFTTPTAFLRLLNQWTRRGKERIESLLKRSSTRAHEYERVMTIFRDCSLTIRSTHCIKASRGGVDYCIHHLDRG